MEWIESRLRYWLTTMNLSIDLVQPKSEMISNRRTPMLLIGGSNCARSGGLSESQKSLQFVCKLFEKQGREGRYFLHAQPKKSKSWHEEFVKNLTGEDHVEKVTVNMDGNAKPTTRSSNAPIIVKIFGELQRSPQVRPKKLVAAIITGLKDQLRTIGWLNSTTFGISFKEEAVEWIAEESGGRADCKSGRAGVDGQTRSLEGSLG